MAKNSCSGFLHLRRTRSATLRCIRTENLRKVRKRNQVAVLKRVSRRARASLCT